MNAPLTSPLARRWGIRGALLTVALVIPTMIPEYRVFNASRILILTLIGFSLVVLTGWTGQISLAHGAFVGIGAWTGASWLHRFDLNIALLVLGGGLCAGLAALLIAVPAIRLRGIYLAAGTLACQIAFEKMFLVEAFHGENGSVTRPSFLGIELISDKSYYYFVLATVVVVGLGVNSFRRSRTGRAWLAVMHLDEKSQVIGIRPPAYRLLAFFFSGAIAGMAGVLLLFLVGGASNQQFLWYSSISYLSVAFVGGIAFLSGSVLGGLMWVLSGEWLGQAAVTYQIVMGTALAVVAAYIPDGFVGSLRKLLTGWQMGAPARDTTPRLAPTAQTPSRRLGMFP
jgi:branched-chain amino acid transport system permease protein